MRRRAAAPRNPHRQPDQRMNEPLDDPHARAMKIADIRRQIYEGTYETPGRLAQAIEKFLERQEPGRFDAPAGDNWLGD